MQTVDAETSRDKHHNITVVPQECIWPNAIQNIFKDSYSAENQG